VWTQKDIGNMMNEDIDKVFDYCLNDEINLFDYDMSSFYKILSSKNIRFIEMLDSKNKYNKNIYNSDLLKNAVYFESEKIVEFILKDKSFNIENEVKYRILENAVHLEKPDIFKLLMADERMGDLDGVKFTKLLTGYIDNLEILEMLLKNNKVTPSYDVSNILSSIIGNKRIPDSVIHNHVKVILDSNKVNPVEINNEPLKKACQLGYIKVVKLLLADPRINPQQNIEESLYYASKNCHYDIIMLLMNDSRITVKDEDNDIFEGACVYGNIKLVEFWLENKITTNRNKSAGFYLACKEGHYEIAKLLMNKTKIKVNDSYLCCIMDAIDSKQFEIAELLWDNKNIREFLKNTYIEDYNEASKIILKRKVERNINAFN